MTLRDIERAIELQCMYYADAVVAGDAAGQKTAQEKLTDLRERAKRLKP